jgi:ABC-2 type transport system permease protein
MATLILTKAFAKQAVIEMTRYAFDTVASLVGMYVLFLTIFYGIRGLGDVTADATLSSLILGFNVWALLSFSYGTVAGGLVGEAQTGTLEQVAMSRSGLLGAVLIRFWVAFVFFVVSIALLLLLAMATTGQWLHLDVLGVAPLLLGSATAVLGIGLAMGGFALVFKRMQNVSGLMQFALVGLVAAPVESLPWVKFVPISLGYQLLTKVMVEGVPISDIPVGDLLILFGGAAVFLLLGAAAFKWLEGMAKDRALLGQY